MLDDIRWIDDLSYKGYAQFQNLFPKEAALDLLRWAQDLKEKEFFRQAEVGKGIRKQTIEELRSDEIYWVEDWSGEVFVPYRDVLLKIQEKLRRDLFLPVKRFEGHIAHYEAGSFYVRHVDRHKVQPHRLISSVLYLSDLLEGEGGELILYPLGKEPVVIRPHLGNVVLFQSQIPHEVKATKKSRWSLTSWFRDDVL